jgi:anti-anti-sigma factor
MDIKKKYIQDVLVIQPSIPVLDAVVAQSFKDQILGLMESESANLIAFDLSTIGFMDSAGLGALIAIYKAIKNKKENCSILNAQPSVMKVFELTGMQGLFTFFPSEKEAINYWRKTGKMS